MKNIIKVLILILLAVGAYLIVDFIVAKSNKDVAVPDLTAISSEYGKVEQVELNEEKYVVYKNLLTSPSEFINKEINAQVEKEAETLINDSGKIEKVKPAEKGVYINSIDTYQVTDNIVSVRLTSMTKPVSSEHYTKLIHVYNYDIKKGQQVALDDFFKEGYKTRIENVYSDTYLLNHTSIEFYKGLETSTCTYNMLKDYLKDKDVLTASNLEVSEDDYSAIFEPKTNATVIITTAETDTATDSQTEATDTTDTASDSQTETTEKQTETTEKQTQQANLPVVQDTGKMIAFSFDDGPHKTNTDEILALLAEYGAHATFFMQGCNASYYPEVVQRVYASGNEIGNHTWDHANLKKSSVETIHQQVDDAANEIQSITGVRPFFVRPPYGAVNDTVREEVAEPMIYWSVDSLDWDSRDPDQIVPLVLSEVEDGDIVLFHDIHATTIPAIARLLPELTEQGYKIVSVGELIAARGYDPYSKEVWYSVPKQE
ncbi:MAG: polysaccharide deacetylase family protein [Eubacterium sp.]|nr:polysaccharide deacetylase family protein [Eubacterium sp.]